MAAREFARAAIAAMGRHARSPAALLTLVAALGCEPSVADYSYFCGPNRSCPPHQECSDADFTCGDPARVQPFQCPADSQDLEPNESTSEASDLGQTQCGLLLASEQGCIIEGSDVDVYTFEHAEACPSRNTVQITLGFPAAFVPLSLVVTDADGNSVGDAVDCSNDDTSGTGNYQQCLEFEADAGIYFVQVAPRLGEDDCSGDCQFNEYSLDVRLPQ